MNIRAQHLFRIFVSAATLVAIVDTASAFDSNVRFCNHTRENLEIAWGYDRSGTSEVTTEGWKKVAVCDCKELFNKSTRATEFWVLAVKSGTFDEVTTGTGPLCVNPKDQFTFLNQNRSPQSCANAGGKWLKFAQGNTQGRSNHTYTLGNRCNL